METFYLVDYENVGSGGVKKCNGLVKYDHLHIFYTDNTKRIDLDIIDNHGSATLETHKVPAGSQSADMHIIREIPAYEKQIHLRDDRGKDELLDFTRKVCRNPYVINVINSLPFNAKDKKFIRKVKAEGLIECVMIWTDKGYGFVIQTTGRNLRETEKIATIINDEYGE